MFTTEREIGGVQYEGVIERFDGETDVYNVYVKQVGQDNEGETVFFFYNGSDCTVESEKRSIRPIGGTWGFSNDETREALEGLFASI